jgi:hypothetical protein
VRRRLNATPQRGLSKALGYSGLAVVAVFACLAAATGRMVFAIISLAVAIGASGWEWSLHCDNCGHQMVKHYPAYPFERFLWMRIERRCRLCHCGRRSDDA